MKVIYWLFIGWWLEPILFIKYIKRRKKENAIINHEYNKIKNEEKQKKEEI